MLAGDIRREKQLQEKLRVYEENLMVPPGHFYSPLVNACEIREREKVIFEIDRKFEAIDMQEKEQWELVEQFKTYYRQLAIPEEQTPGKRFYFNNGFFSYSDAVFLASIILHHKPKRIIEIGSGFSSGLMIDVNEQFFNGAIDITFIEPYPHNLKALVQPGDRFTLLEKKVQQVELAEFNSLQENDLLFIDSTHVAKTGSDVLFEVFEVLPTLNRGVKIHFHDIFFPFEYPKQWVVEEKRSWNEIYLLRAFLMYNERFRIHAFNSFLTGKNPGWFEQHMPLCLKNTGGSCWLEKVE
jgi:predicted O-methyltransferase YrrM